MNTRISKMLQRAVFALKTLKTGTKMTGAFLAIALIIVGTAVVGYVSVKSVSVGMATMYEDRLLPAQQLGEVNDAQLKMGRDLYRFILESENRNALAQDIAGHVTVANEAVRRYEKTYLVPDEKRLLAEFRPAWAAYLQAVADGMRQVKAGHAEEAVQSLLKGGAVFAAQQTVNRILTRLIAVQVQVGIALKQAGDRTFARVSAIMTATGVIGVLLAIVLGMLMGRSITIPLARITSVATEMAEGKLDASLLLGIESWDEIGILARTFTLMAGKLKLTMEGIRESHIRFLQSLEQVDQAIKRAPDVEQMLRHILETVFLIFDCDRVWLFYPCDPDAPAFRVPLI
ncbi:MAG: MCP four helix bundle domain-containing protein, partial [Lentisphaerota bacterium]